MLACIREAGKKLQFLCTVFVLCLQLMKTPFADWLAREHCLGLEEIVDLTFGSPAASLTLNNNANTLLYVVVDCSPVYAQLYIDSKFAARCWISRGYSDKQLQKRYFVASKILSSIHF